MVGIRSMWRKLSTPMLFLLLSPLLLKQTARLATTVLPQPWHISWYPFSILHKDLWLVKKSAFWVPYSAIGGRERRHLHLLLRRSKTRGGASWATSSQYIESAVPLHTLETKTQSTQWLEKGKPGYIKEGVQASQPSSTTRGWCGV